jgi:serine/threonine protein kinase
VIGPCPSDADLARWMAQQMDAMQRQSLEVHLARCPSCQLRMESQPTWRSLPSSEGPDPAAEALLSDDQPTAFGPGRIVPPFRPEVTPQSAAPSPAAIPGIPPAAFGRYRVIKPLGAGGFGTVYLCEDTELSRQVAIKVSRRGPDTSPVEMERFMEEARRLARLNHPGIVTVFDVGMQEGSVYVVSAFLEGSDLADWLKKNRPTWQVAGRIAAAVAEALAHAHSRLIVHRDVKPSNIILSAELEPILVDFGLALDDRQTAGSEKGIYSGTPWYMSPEQAAGTAHRIDGRTDVYGLGVVLYEMLTGHVPFRARNLQELMRQVRDDEPQPPRQLVRDIPPELERVCLKALAKEQRDRYTTVGDFADDLRRVISSSTGKPSHRPLPGETTPPMERLAAPGSTRDSTKASSSSRRRAREAELRQVTLLVCGCDLFDSDTYLESLEAEDQAKVLRAYQQACEQIVTRFDGSIVQWNESGLLACFGYPTAYEDAARRAVRTGFGILDHMVILGDQLRKEHALELHVWVGIHTGSAVAESGETSI